MVRDIKTFVPLYLFLFFFFVFRYTIISYILYACFFDIKISLKFSSLKF